MQALDEFKRRVYSEWLEPYCDQRGYAHGGFVHESMDRLSEDDARHFMDAIDHGLVTHKQGAFRAPCSRAKEYLFWEGARNTSPRRLTLWLEPVITIAGLRRMQSTFGWPAEQLGAQSVSYAFDFVGYQADQKTELVACEVKPTKNAIDLMVYLMKAHPGITIEALNDFKPAERNALKKLIALRESTCHTFWALGPDNYGHILSVTRDVNGEVTLTSTTELALCYEVGRPLV